VLSEKPWQDGRPGRPQKYAKQWKADILAGKAAGKAGYSKAMFIAYPKLRISDKFRDAKDLWRKVPGHHRIRKYPPGP
jgi:hypothetical protein